MSKISIFLFLLAILAIPSISGEITTSSKKDYFDPANPMPAREENITLPSDDLLLGQNFVVGIYGTSLDSETKKYLLRIKPAGIILYSRNCATPSQLKNFVAELQEFAKSTSGYYYFMMIDEEPGGASRLNLFRNVFEFGTPEWDKIERDIKNMAMAGINVNLAPLADFPFNEDTFIKKRIQAHTPEALIDFNAKFIALSQKNNVSATLKHFPGMGVFVDDPHQKIPYVRAGQKIIDESLGIFKGGIDAGVDFVMTGHGVYDDIDYDIPATLSEKITTGILRNTLGFKGLIITDDLSDMPFIVGKEMNLTDATAESLKAGHNLVIFSHNQDKAGGVYEKLLQRLGTDQELRSVVEKNYRDIISFKNKHPLSSVQ